MPDYKTMYAILCKAFSDAVDRLDATIIQTEQTYKARKILTEALDEAENIYIETCVEEEG